MTINLSDYLTQRHGKKAKRKSRPGPVITISREFGCEANVLAPRLAKALSKKGHPWNIISKQILEEASQKLKMSRLELEQAFTPHQKNYFDELFSGFSLTPDISEKKVHQIIKDVVYSYAEQGHVIIVGRGGVAIAKEIPKSLHVRLMAPTNYRASKISKKRGITIKRAEEIISSQDKRRRLFIQMLRGEIVDKTIFDIVLNRESLNDHQIIDTIMAAAKSRKLW